MLAYLFWHEPREGVDEPRYVALLQDFHRTLAAAAPPGFVRSWSVRLDAAPWEEGPPRRFEDWYARAAVADARDAAERLVGAS